MVSIFPHFSCLHEFDSNINNVGIIEECEMPDSWL